MMDNILNDFDKVHEIEFESFNRYYVGKKIEQDMNEFIQQNGMKEINSTLELYKIKKYDNSIEKALTYNYLISNDKKFIDDLNNYQLKNDPLLFTFFNLSLNKMENLEGQIKKLEQVCTDSQAERKEILRRFNLVWDKLTDIKHKCFARKLKRNEFLYLIHFKRLEFLQRLKKYYDSLTAFIYVFHEIDQGNK